MRNKSLPHCQTLTVVNVCVTLTVINVCVTLTVVNVCVEYFGIKSYLSWYQVSFQWKIPDFLSKNPDFLLRILISY